MKVFYNKQQTLLQFLAIAEKLWLVLLFKNRKFYFAKDENWAKFNENSEFMERYTYLGL